MLRRTVFFLIVLVAAAMIAGCHKDDSTPTSPGTSNPTTYVGTLGNSAEAGTMTLTFQSAPSKAAYSAASVPITGSIKIGGTTINLTGTYDPDTDNLTVAGGEYTFTGHWSSGSITGSYTGPNGAGSFTAQGAESAGAVKVYNGTYHETYPDTSNHGRFLLIFKGAVITGLTDGGDKIGGSLTQSHVSLHDVRLPDFEVASGTMSQDGTTISGTYATPDGDITVTGTWHAVYEP